MAKVLGIGGVFFKTDDGEGLRDWYRKVLDFEIEGWGGIAFPPPPKGCTVWSPFAADTGYFAPSTAPFMINFIVDDLDEVLAKVVAAGVEPLGRDDTDPSGRFAWLLDPAGVKIELWEPQPQSPPQA